MQTGLETKCIHEGWKPKSGESRQLPIIQSTTFPYATSDEMGQLFDLEAAGYFYTRLQNPTNDAVAAKICALEGGVQQCLLHQDRQLTFLLYLIYARAETTLSLHRQYTEEHIICSE